MDISIQILLNEVWDQSCIIGLQNTTEMNTCEYLRLATAVQSCQYDDVKDRQSCLIWILAGRSSVVVINNFEGEQDWDQKALATGAFRRPHVCSKVDNGLLVAVKAQVMKSMSFSKKQNTGLYAD